jgi:hypothetical protein
LPSSSLSGVCSLILFQLFAGVTDTGGKFAAGVVDTGGNLSPCRNTGGKFATGVNNTRGTGTGNLPQVLLIPVVHLDLQYLREFSKKFEMILMLLSGAWGKVIHEKNLKQKIL